MKLLVRNVDTRIDGEYDCQIANRTAAEEHFIRQTCGLTPPAVPGGFISQDAGLIVALAAIVLNRLGKSYELELLWDASVGVSVMKEQPDPGDMSAVIFWIEDVEETSPPEQPPRGGNGSAKSSASAAGRKRSGRSSKTSTENQG